MLYTLDVFFKMFHTYAKILCDLWKSNSIPGGDGNECLCSFDAKYQLVFWATSTSNKLMAVTINV